MLAFCSMLIMPSVGGDIAESDGRGHLPAAPAGRLTKPSSHRPAIALEGCP